MFKSKTPKTFNTIITNIAITGNLSLANKSHTIINDGFHVLDQVIDGTADSTLTIDVSATVITNQITVNDLNVNGHIVFANGNHKLVKAPHQFIRVKNLTIGSSGTIEAEVGSNTTLIVEGLLTIKAHGQISGINSIQCGNLVMEKGAQMWGNISKYCPTVGDLKVVDE